MYWVQLQHLYSPRGRATNEVPYTVCGCWEGREFFFFFFFHSQAARNTLVRKCTLAVPTKNALLLRGGGGGGHGLGLGGGARLGEDGVLHTHGVTTLGGALEGVRVLGHVGGSLGLTVFAADANAGRLGGDGDGGGGAGGGDDGGGEPDEGGTAGGRGLLLGGAHGHDSLGLLGLGSLGLLGEKRERERVWGLGVAEFSIVNFLPQAVFSGGLIEKNVFTALFPVRSGRV